MKNNLNLENAFNHSVQNARSMSNIMNSTIHRGIILSVVLYGCETWSLTWREEYRLWLFKNRLLRKIFVC
jgi:hypothetical protein